MVKMVCNSLVTMATTEPVHPFSPTASLPLTVTTKQLLARGFQHTSLKHFLLFVMCVDTSRGTLWIQPFLFSSIHFSLDFFAHSSLSVHYSCLRPSCFVPLCFPKLQVLFIFLVFHILFKHVHFGVTIDLFRSQEDFVGDKLLYHTQHSAGNAQV